MLLTDELRARVAEVDFDFDAEPKERLASCNLCGGTLLVTIAHHDRYGFASRTDMCRRCGLAFLNPRLTPDAYARFYATTYRPLVSAFHGRRIDAETIEEEQSAYADALVGLLAPFVDGGRAKRLLDVGGSTGVVAHRLSTAYGFAATVVDPSPEEVARARARGIDGRVATIESFSTDGERWELVAMCQTIDHLLDVSGALAKLRGLIAEDGLLFVDIVDFRAALLRNWSVELATKIDHPFALTEPTVEALLARAAFEVTHVEYAADHLHVAYVCRPTRPSPTLPETDSVRSLLGEIRLVQNAPRPT